ncbi:hypothetical protein AKJ62_01310 [candidate division MSBL1 archaeon SCGC-AAA259D14]|uniref:Uncharacterized protein n=1 Tax=candidate division MSBL1 archaeon SCGC-AAA259D14 TaxID=1698261 RepID=A0A133U7V5_9EURY|nr:hypothetical protein AKJ62_01310 [candidate division MSBL1 archaeon SCGC-AAA259D14]
MATEFLSSLSEKGRNPCDKSRTRLETRGENTDHRRSGEELRPNPRGEWDGMDGNRFQIPFQNIL